ncbi:hypothetical protein FJU08_01820 [Martelella alba]|uniref:SGNH hydrolase-type esterase domain-containing protein n=1 Tax=Martelella alba TaxID=2590451 RepID=A0A506UJ82_9HYPH|nr:GDSL-type esterase/lipase family protein [Martelella alba]TPW33323.1 hypothetical protein FJU08_01820 [Martelella alba]
MKIIFSFIALFYIFFPGVILAQTQLDIKAFSESCDEISLSIVSSPTPPQYASSLKIWNDKRPTKFNDADILIIGDSIFEAWNENLAEEILGKSVVNLSVGWDRIQNVLWRLDDFDRNLVNPSTIALLIGTNNFNDKSTETCAISAGIKFLVAKIHSYWPSASIFLFSIPPRGAEYFDFEEDRQEINKSLEDWSNKQKSIHWVQIDDMGISCNQRAEPKTENRPACFVSRSCYFYKNDNLHFQPIAYEYFSKLLKINIEKFEN